LKVYPNPASTHLTIDIEKPGNYHVTLTGIAGQTVLSQKSINIDISSLPNGTYLLTIYDADNKPISRNKVEIIK
jgi:hypothetical protein